MCHFYRIAAAKEVDKHCRAKQNNPNNEVHLQRKLFPNTRLWIYIAKMLVHSIGVGNKWMQWLSLGKLAKAFKGELTRSTLALGSTSSLMGEGVFGSRPHDSYNGCA